MTAIVLGALVKTNRLMHRTTVWYVVVLYVVSLCLLTVVKRFWNLKVGNETNVVKCSGVDPHIVESRLECEIKATEGVWEFYTYSERKSRCQVMNHTGEDEGNCRDSGTSE